MTKVTKNLLNTFEWWPNDAADPEIKNRIKREAFYINTFFVVNAIVGLASGVLHAIPLEDDKELFYALVIFEEFAPKWKFWLEWLYRMSFLVVPLVMTYTSHIGIYMCARFWFQFYTYNEYLKKINFLSDAQQTPDLIENQNYQNEIKKRLVFCIKRNIHMYTQVFLKNI